MTQASGRPYYPQLDTLRALAILGVLIDHWNVPFPDLLRFGQISVRFFFILSGMFVVTSVGRIMDKKDAWKAVWGFYGRRLWRIFPAYYLALAVLMALGVEEVRQQIWIHGLFLTNFWIVDLGWFPDQVAHFWSLAVQEQFYLIFPWVVALLPWHWMPWVAVGMLGVAVGFRGACFWFETSDLFRWLMLPGALDSFGVGAFLGWLQISGKGPAWRPSAGTLMVGTVMSFVLFYGALFFCARSLDPRWIVGNELLQALAMGWMIALIMWRSPRCLVPVLMLRPLRFLGRMSYGVYVVHLSVSTFLDPWLAVWLGEPKSLAAGGRVMILFAVTVVIATMSYHWVERPLQQWGLARCSLRNVKPTGSNSQGDPG